MAFDILERTWKPDYGTWYDFASATYDANGYLGLWSGGCLINGENNCTATCLDESIGPSHVWNGTNSTMTLQNCMTLPFIAYALATGNLTTNAVKLASKYHIPSDPHLVNKTNAGWPVINNCINQFCEAANSTTPGCFQQNSADSSPYVFYPTETIWNNGDPTTVNLTFQGVRIGIVAEVLDN